jgi:hypothetical protein
MCPPSASPGEIVFLLLAIDPVSLGLADGELGEPGGEGKLGYSALDVSFIVLK